MGIFDSPNTSLAIQALMEGLGSAASGYRTPYRGRPILAPLGGLLTAGGALTGGLAQQALNRRTMKWMAEQAGMDPAQFEGVDPSVAGPFISKQLELQQKDEQKRQEEIGKGITAKGAFDVAQSIGTGDTDWTQMTGEHGAPLSPEQIKAAQRSLQGDILQSALRNKQDPATVPFMTEAMAGTGYKPIFKTEVELLQGASQGAPGAAAAQQQLMGSKMTGPLAMALREMHLDPAVIIPGAAGGNAQYAQAMRDAQGLLDRQKVGLAGAETKARVEATYGVKMNKPLAIVSPSTIPLRIDQKGNLVPDPKATYMDVVNKKAYAAKAGEEQRIDAINRARFTLNQLKGTLGAMPTNIAGRVLGKRYRTLVEALGGTSSAKMTQFKSDLQNASKAMNMAMGARATGTGNAIDKMTDAIADGTATPEGTALAIQDDLAALDNMRETMTGAALSEATSSVLPDMTAGAAAAPGAPGATAAAPTTPSEPGVY